MTNSDYEAQRADALTRARVLAEALPWINSMSGKTIVVKYGGSAMEDPELREAVISDLVLMKLIGMRLVIVHGGGKAISSLMSRLELPVEFKDGMRVTSEEAMEAVQMALIGKVNQELVRSMNAYGDYAVGLSGSDGCLLKAKQISPELGRVGRVSHVGTQLIESLLDDGYIPLIAGVATDENGPLNVNADLVASEIARSLKADRLAFLTDVDGLYRDFNDKSTLISRLSLAETRELLASGTLSSGMIPKITASAEAIESGVGGVHILNGTFPHSLLLEIFTDLGVGTMISYDGIAYGPSHS